MSNIKLVSVRVSSHCLYPNDTLYLECSFESLCDHPAGEKLDIFCDFLFGHMNNPECNQKNYRVVMPMYPQPMHWKKGNVYTCGLHWKIRPDMYGGTFELNVGMANSEAVPEEFEFKGKNVHRCYVGDIEVAFGGCAPKFVNSHKTEMTFEFDKISSNSVFDSGNEGEVYIRRKADDSIITDLFTGSRYCGEYAGFELKKTVGDIDEKTELVNITEKDGYELLEVKFPNLVSSANSKMITVFGSGRLIDSTENYSFGYEQTYYQRNVGIIKDSDSFTVVETPYLDDKLHHSIFRVNGVPYASVGVTLTYRVRAYGDLESLKVINNPAFVIKKANSQPELLYYLRKDLKLKSMDYYRTLFYYFQIECDGFDEVNTFNGALERVKQIYNLTGGMKQVMLLRGWQHEGHDTGYPDVFTINRKAGTLDDLKHLVTEARKYNAIVTFHDNYDDMYDELPYFDPEIASADCRGGMYKSWIWVSGISRMTSFKKYVTSGKMAARVKKTVEMYPVKDSYHLDVMSQEVRRYDFDPKVKAAAQESLEYKKAVIREFEKYGFNVTSEGVSQPFAGIIAHAWCLGVNYAKVFFKESYFPLLAMIYHGLYPYSGGSDYLNLICGATIVPDICGDVKKYKDVYFKKALPLNMLWDKQIDDYSKESDIYKVYYSDGSIVVYDKKNDTLTVENNKEILTKDGNVLVKGYKDNEYIGYTESGKMTIDKKNIKEIHELDFDGMKAPVNYTLTDDGALIETNAKTGFKVILND